MTTTSTTLRSDDFSCPSCVTTIESKLTGLEGVSSAEVKFSSGRILIDHDPQIVNVRELVGAVKDVGYDAKPSAI